MITTNPAIISQLPVIDNPTIKVIVEVSHFFSMEDFGEVLDFEMRSLCRAAIGLKPAPQIEKVSENEIAALYFFGAGTDKVKTL